MNRFLALAVCGVLSFGCAKPPQQYVVQNTRVYDNNFDTTWAHLVQFLTSNNIQLKTIEKASGVIYAEKSLVDSQGIVDCGSPGIALVVSTTGTLNVLVTTEGGKTKVTVNVTYGQIRQFDNAVFPAKCVSTGGLEQQILNSL